MIRYFQNPLPKSKHVDEKVSNSTIAVPENDPAPCSPLPLPSLIAYNSPLITH